MSSEAQKKPSRKTVWILLLIICLVVAAICAGALFWYFRSPEPTPIDTAEHTVSTFTTQATQSTEQHPQTTAATTQALPENPIDFSAWQAENADLYAWIYIPNTDIDLPIMQPDEEKDDNFYLHHNIDLNYEYKGMLYTQRANSKDFTDPVTVIYGHNMLDGTMFSNLEFFRDSAFFDANEFFYIYTPGHILTYQIVSAHQYDTRHILNSFDFSDTAVFQSYLDMIQAPKTYISDVREGITLTTDDRIVTLSTCIYRSAARYLIQGVLISDEPTN